MSEANITTCPPLNAASTYAVWIFGFVNCKKRGRFTFICSTTTHTDHTGIEFVPRGEGYPIHALCHTLSLRLIRPLPFRPPPRPQHRHPGMWVIATWCYMSSNEGKHKERFLLPMVLGFVTSFGYVARMVLGDFFRMGVDFWDNNARFTYDA